ncbi:hypothetical protein EGW08_003091 [Elysia chlorotica]|uniref:Uncharacterized protein n=1 Tax=Elysia chlorotica TaxID=188477 RepID=A0A433U636_ELYCH|nr:hypothetical protein EGW08_003091 [Elysia chlorotica]
MYKISIRGKNQHIPEFPASVSPKWIHNHAICTASTLLYRDATFFVRPAAEEKLIEFFNDGLSPSSALGALHRSIEDDPNYVTIMGDRQIVPDYFFVNRLFNRYFENMYGKMKGEIMFADILKHVKSLDIKTANYIDRNDLIIAIVTPLVERVYQLVPQSGEIAFMDASDSMDSVPQLEENYGSIMQSTGVAGYPAVQDH